MKNKQEKKSAEDDEVEAKKSSRQTRNSQLRVDQKLKTIVTEQHDAKVIALT